MLNYFTIPEIDIAFTIATTKLWSVQKFKIVAQFHVCVWVCAPAGVSVYTLQGLWSYAKVCIKSKVFLLPKEGKTMLPVFKAIAQIGVTFFHALLYFPIPF